MYYSQIQNKQAFACPQLYGGQLLVTVTLCDPIENGCSIPIIWIRGFRTRLEAEDN